MENANALIDIYEPADAAWPTGVSTVAEIIAANDGDDIVVDALNQAVTRGVATLDLGAGGTVRFVKATIEQVVWEVWFYDDTDEYVGAHTEQFETEKAAKAWAKANRRAHQGWSLTPVTALKVSEVIGRGNR